MHKLGLQPIAMNPGDGSNPTLPQWLQDFVHTYGGPSLSAGSSPHGSLHGVAGGSDYATDVTGSSADMDRLAKYLYDNPALSAQMIHQGADGFDYGVAGGQKVPYGSYYNTPGGTYADEAPMVHWAPALGSGGSPFSGASLGGPGGPGGPGMPQQAQLTGFGQPDPSAQGGGPGGTDAAAPPAPIGPPAGGGWQPQGGGGNGVGGLPEAALMTAASMFPGGGAAAQTAMQLINRTIGYGQQAAAIGVQGLMDTFKISSPDGDDGGKSDLSQGWAGRVAAGFAGARPAMPNAAGAAPTPKKSSDPTKDPSGKEALGQDSGDTHNVYGGMNIPGSGNTININPPQSPSMNDASTGLSAASSAPATTSMAGMAVV